MNTSAWLLILFAHVGPIGQGNSNALTTNYLNTQQACIAAGEAAKQMASGTVKSIDYRCVKVQ